VFRTKGVEKIRTHILRSKSVPHTHTHTHTHPKIVSFMR